MAFKHMLLAAVAQKPGAGYSLHRRFPTLIRPDLAQIYRALNQLHSDGLVEIKVISQEKVPPKKIYYITSSGHEELQRWLQTENKSMTLYNEVLVQIFNGNLFKKEDIIDKLHAFIDAKKNELKEHKIFMDKITKAQAGKPAEKFGFKFYTNMSSDYVYKRIEMELNWAESALKKFDVH